MDLAVSPASDLLVTSEGDEAHVYDLAGGQVRSRSHFKTDQAEGTAARQRAVVFSSNGILFATTGEDAKIRVWKSASEARQRTLTGHTKAVRALDFNAYGSQIVSVATDGTCKTWQVAFGTMIRSFAAERGTVFRSCFFSRRDGGKTVLIGATCDGMATVLVMAADSGIIERTVPVLSGRLNCMAYSTDGRYVALAAGEAGALAVLETASWTKLLEANIGPINLTGLAFTRDARFVVAVSMDGYARSVRLAQRTGSRALLLLLVGGLGALLAMLALLYRFAGAS